MRYFGGVGLGIRPIYDIRFLKGIHHLVMQQSPAGLSGRLGDFTVRYAGPARPRGHRIIVEDADGMPASGYRTAHGRALHPELVIGNKSHLRAAMAGLLRQYAAALRLG
ncbi:hypothetical protein [Sphingomonas sp. IC081]|uniref:hypothetical protein n=1 Tax=Sphingomonas sp. IC081 TaxID=304378 RepID=UPI0021AF5220|nr:hypothetical protein [Sphingomonas sp. IC081]